MREDDVRTREEDHIVGPAPNSVVTKGRGVGGVPSKPRVEVRLNAASAASRDHECHVRKA